VEIGKEQESRRGGLTQVVVPKIGASLAAMKQIVAHLPDCSAQFVKIADLKGISMPITATSVMTVLLGEGGQNALDRVAP